MQMAVRETKAELHRQPQSVVIHPLTVTVDCSENVSRCRRKVSACAGNPDVSVMQQRLLFVYTLIIQQTHFHRVSQAEG